MTKRITALLLTLCVSVGSFASCGKIDGLTEDNKPKAEKGAQGDKEDLEELEKDLEYANGAAKSAYNGIMEYSMDKQTFDNIPLDNTVASFFGKNIDCSGERPADNGAAAIWDWVGGEGYVVIFQAEIDGMNNFAVQWKSSPDSDIIGQYPKPIDVSESRDTTWGVFTPGADSKAE